MKQQILFVDDEPYVLESLRRLLQPRSAFWEMYFAESADAALALMQEHKIDTVVTDVRMPGRSGFDLLKAIHNQAHTQDIPVIILTGEHDTELKRHALDMGAADLLNKPISIPDLIARLSSVLRLKSYQDVIKHQNQMLEARVQERTRELHAAWYDIIWRLAKAGEYRDEETGNHVLRVAHYCRAIGEAMGFGSEFNDMLSITSPLHDIGKIGIPDSILHKPGKLTREEWAVMQSHCEIGARILREDYAMMLYQVRGEVQKEDHREEIQKEVQKEMRLAGRSDCLVGGSQHVGESNPLLEMAATIALYHHEKWNGEGYPHGLVGEEIPIAARIVALADVYDALGSVRPYKPAFAQAEVMVTMEAGAGKHFDPAVYAAFLRSVDLLRAIREEYPQERGRRWEKVA